MSDEHTIDCAFVVYCEWFRQSFVVFTDIERARAELAAYGATVEAGLGGAGYADHPDGSAIFWIVFKTPEPNAGTIVHECIHAVDYLFEFVGAPVSVENSECRCYLTEWLFGKVADGLAELPAPC